MLNAGGSAWKRILPRILTASPPSVPCAEMSAANDLVWLVFSDVFWSTCAAVSCAPPPAASPPESDSPRQPVRDSTTAVLSAAPAANRRLIKGSSPMIVENIGEYDV